MRSVSNSVQVTQKSSGSSLLTSPGTEGLLSLHLNKFMKFTPVDSALQRS